MRELTRHQGRRLGLKAIKTDTRTLKLCRYLGAAPLAPPPSANWTKGVTSFGEMENDTLGDCTIAGVGHAIQMATLNTGGMVTVADSIVQSAYSKWCGYVPGNPSTDNGGIELDVLTDWQQQGLGGHGLTAFADPTLGNLAEYRQSIALFGGLYIGITLTNAQVEADEWDVIPNDNSGIAGGHCVFVPRYDADGSFICITWGELRRMTPAFVAQAWGEAHTLIMPDWFEKSGVDPTGLNLAQLQADLAIVRA